MGIQINNKQVLDMNYLGKKAYSAVLNGDYIFASTKKSISGNPIRIEDAGAYDIERLYFEGNSYQKSTQQGRNICPTDINDWELGQWTTEGNKNTYQNRIRVNRLIPCKPSTQYYAQSFLQNIIFAIRTYKQDGSFNKSIGTVYRGNTFTTDENSYYLAITLYSEASATDDLLALIESGEIKPYITLNSETNRNFEEYIPNSPSPDFPQDVEVVENVEVEVTGKNLFTTNNSILGVYLASGFDSTRTEYRSTFPLKVKDGETYTFSISTEQYFIIAFLDRDKNFVSRITETKKSHTFTIPKDVEYISISIQTRYIDVYDMQLEKGSATEYEPYNGTIKAIDLQGNFLAKIGDIYDELDVVTGKLTKRIGKVVLDGSENWTQTGTQFDGLYSAYINLTSMKRTSVFDDILSSHFKSRSFWIGEEGITKSGEPLNYDYMLLRLSNTKATTVNELKTWLASNNVEVYYVLAEPYEVQLDTTKIPLFEGINNVRVITNLEPSLTELDYYIR